MANQKSNKRGGFYFHNGLPYASVTGILQIIDKPALRFWFGREVYWATVRTPGIGEKEALAAPWSVSGKAKNRGTTVHSIVESFKETGRVLTPENAEYQGYATAFDTWVKEYQAVILEHEKTVVNEKEGYGGTLDLHLKVGGDDCIIDVKTGKDIYMESGLQLSAYKHCDGMDIKRIGVLLLMPEGVYKFQWMEDDFEAFLAAKKLWEWSNKDMLAKVNYYRR
jgi:hypothetical protein